MRDGALPAVTDADSGTDRQISGSWTSTGTPAPRSLDTMTSAPRFTSSGRQRGMRENSSTRPHGSVQADLIQETLFRRTDWHGFVLLFGALSNWA